MVSTHISDAFGQQERSLKLSRRFPPKRKYVSNSWIEAFVKKYVFTRRKKGHGLYQPENPFPLPGMKHSFKHSFPLCGKTASSGKRIGKWFPLAGKYSTIKIDSFQFQTWFPTAEKKGSGQKQTVSTRQKISFLLPE